MSSYLILNGNIVYMYPHNTNRNKILHHWRYSGGYRLKGKQKGNTAFPVKHMYLPLAIVLLQKRIGIQEGQ